MTASSHEFKSDISLKDTHITAIMSMFAQAAPPINSIENLTKLIVFSQVGGNLEDLKNLIRQLQIARPQLVTQDNFIKILNSKALTIRTVMARLSNAKPRLDTQTNLDILVSNLDAISYINCMVSYLNHPRTLRTVFSQENFEILTLCKELGAKILAGFETAVNTAEMNNTCISQVTVDNIITLAAQSNKASLTENLQTFFTNRPYGDPNIINTILDYWVPKYR